MTTAYETQIEGCTGEFSSEINGYIFTRTLKLIGVVEDPTSGEVPDIDQAFSALVDNFVPGIGSDLSDVDSDLAGCWLRNIKVTPLGNNQWRVVLQYQHSPLNDVTGAVKISTSTQTSEVQSNKDKDGESINTIYLYPDDYKHVPELAGTFSDAEGGTFSKLVPETTRTYQLREGVDPKVYKNIVGTVNANDWIDAGDAENWMFVAVSGDTDNSQRSPQEWVNSYTFQYRVDGWMPEVVFTDSNTNEPVPDPQFQYQSSDAKGLASKVIVQAYIKNNFTTIFEHIV